MSQNDKGRRPSALRRFFGFCLSLTGLGIGGGVFVAFCGAAAAFGAMHGLFGFESGPHDLMRLRLYSGVIGLGYALLLFVSGWRSWLLENRLIVGLITLGMPVAFTLGLWFMKPTFTSEASAFAPEFMQSIRSAAEMTALWSSFRAASLLPAWIVILLGAVAMVFWPQPAARVQSAQLESGLGVHAGPGPAPTLTGRQLREQKIAQQQRADLSEHASTEPPAAELRPAVGPQPSAARQRMPRSDQTMTGAELKRKRAAQRASAWSPATPSLAQTPEPSGSKPQHGTPRTIVGAMAETGAEDRRTASPPVTAPRPGPATTRYRAPARMGRRRPPTDDD